MKVYPCRLLMLGAAYALLFGHSAVAQFTNIRIGDQDGFGFPTTVGLMRAAPNPQPAADTNGNGMLQQGEFLPDLNGNGNTATGSGDDFDNRSATEKLDGLIQGSGFLSSAGSAGSKWTDISLSTSFTGSGFPDSSGVGVPNEPLFQFRFTVDKTDLVSGTTMFFNLIFGDYDVVPASVRVTRNNGSGGAGTVSTIGLTTQPGNADGLIQAAFLNLSFADVFSDSGTTWTGYLDVKFQAPNEPFTAFDFAELSVDQIPFEPPQNVPDSGQTCILLACALAGILGLRSRNAAR